MSVSVSASEPPSRDPERFAPVFVLTTARSYSSVVTAMIGQHPALTGLPELFCYPTIGELEASLPSYWRERGVTHRSRGLVRAVAQLEYGGQQLGDVEKGSPLASSTLSRISA